ncbi:tail fiber domain-containing protein [Parapedobacter indicus]|uniref:Head domain of trimeric autotransporter adhesin n=1 Tax=Parapedobacter indicus TaxID=1477437 RepID=A0A1I3S1Y2_9SPHI|nr:tail fiber domain-containing protein [Parapedobacter indicus]PPK99890.1 trimeric autotransporter adhesin [Parapedobacter indicus]SFJ52685.1 Head domain of trimeric autotransporter adhesin [Parapedobacter indicus]
MKRILLVLFCAIAYQSVAQVGLGTNDPKAGLHVVDRNVVFSAAGDVTVSERAPLTDANRRLMWYPEQAAFRAGLVNSYGVTYWDTPNIGNYSFSTGENTRASGEYSIAMNLATTASGDGAVAMGNNAAAIGNHSVAFSGTAGNTGSVVIGSGAQAESDHAMALGPSSIARGGESVTFGPSKTYGDFSMAIGLQNNAWAPYSIAIGKNANSGRLGSMVLSDGSAGFSSDSTVATAANQLAIRGANGIRLFTNSELSSGVELAAAGGGWNVISDRRAKENFQTISATEAESILQKVATIPIARWNYKSQPTTQLHIGPMAQDFHAAFQLDGLANDTTINTVDIDGVNMVAIQALERRTTALRSGTDNLAGELAAMDQRLAVLEAWVAGLMAGSTGKPTK